MDTRCDFDPQAGACHVPRVLLKGAVRLTQTLLRASSVGTAADPQGWRLQHLGSSLDTVAVVLRAELTRPDASPAGMALETYGEHRLARVLAEIERFVALVRTRPAVVAAEVPVRFPWSA